VFTAYATRCGSERIPPLNPASFGKLVRIIFPNVSTRRLGMRGESKYHYTELALDVQESNQESSALQQAQRVMVESYDRVHEVGKANLQRYVNRA
jgi:regulatory factor X